MAWYVYMLRCAPDTLYTGSTPDPERRLRQHLSLSPGGAKYTRSHPPQALAALWETPDAHAAHSLEWHIKRLTRAKKQALLDAPDQLACLLGERADRAKPLDTAPYASLFPDLS
jgi:putative endonuclease